MKEQQIVLTKEDGTEEIADILFTYEANSKKYVVFKFLASEEISAAIFIEDNASGGFISDIETDEEWDMIDEVLQAYFDDLEDQDDESEDEDN